jgi:hypothetical protein
MLYILWLFSSLWAPWLVNKISCIFKMISLLNIDFTVLYIVMGTKQGIFFLIKDFGFFPFVLCTLCCQFLWIVFFISLSLRLRYSTTFIYKIIEANCPFGLEQCLSTFYFFSNYFDALHLSVYFSVIHW